MAIDKGVGHARSEGAPFEGGPATFTKDVVGSHIPRAGRVDNNHIGMVALALIAALFDAKEVGLVVAHELNNARKINVVPASEF